MGHSHARQNEQVDGGVLGVDVPDHGVGACYWHEAVDRGLK